MLYGAAHREGGFTDRIGLPELFCSTGSRWIKAETERAAART